MLAFLLLPMSYLCADEGTSKVMAFANDILSNRFMLWVVFPTLGLFLPALGLKHFDICVFYTDRTDITAASAGTVLPFIIYVLLGAMVPLVGLSRDTAEIIAKIVAGGVCLVGWFVVIKNAVTENLDVWYLIPFVIIVKIYFGVYAALVVGLGRGARRMGRVRGIGGLFSGFAILLNVTLGTMIRALAEDDVDLIGDD